MRRTSPSRIVTLGLLVAASSMLVGCIAMPPTAEAPPESSTPATEPAATDPAATDPAETEPAETEPAETEPAEPEDPQYEAVADDGAGLVWSFEPTEVEVIETDATGTSADDGRQLVLVHIDGQLIEGEGNFYYDFTVKLVDDETGTLYGLSSGTTFLAENDLFFAGVESFTDGQGIYQVPASMDVGHVRFIMNDTGEAWDFEL